MRISRYVPLIASLVFLPAVAGIQSASRQGQDIDTILRKSQEAWNRLESGSADFTQTWKSAAGDPQSVKRGRITYVKPGKLHVVYSAPEPITAVLEGSRVLVYYAREKSADQLTAPFVENVLATLGAGQSPEMTKLIYTVTKSEHQRSDAHSLDFVLKVGVRSEKDLAKFRIGFDKTTFLTRRSELINKKGDSVHFEFGPIDQKARIDPALFQFQPPAGTNVRSQTDLSEMLRPLFSGDKN